MSARSGRRAAAGATSRAAGRAARAPQRRTRGRRREEQQRREGSNASIRRRRSRARVDVRRAADPSLCRTAWPRARRLTAAVGACRRRSAWRRPSRFSPNVGASVAAEGDILHHWRRNGRGPLGGPARRARRAVFRFAHAQRSAFERRAIQAP
jgi:hypothetical protein